MRNIDKDKIFGKSNTTPNIHRRTALKSLVASGGLVAGSQALPETWRKPVVDTVFLPAHAMMSPLGIFTTEAIDMADNSKWWEGNTLLEGLIPATLESVIPTASALDSYHNDVGESACQDNKINIIVIFRILQNGDVDICFSTTGGFQECTGQTSSTLLPDNKLVDTSILRIDESIDIEDDQERVDLFSMEYDPDAMTVTGAFDIFNEDNGNKSCKSIKFTANLVPTDQFICVPGCGDSMGSKIIVKVTP